MGSPSPPSSKPNGNVALFKGAVYTKKDEEGRLDHPRLWYTGGSLNSQKASLFLRCSSLEYDKIEFQSISYPEYNQSLEYAQICPNMSIPAMEIENIIITDSREIQRYLAKHYPSKGDQAVLEDKAKLQEMEDFIYTCLEWDEYLFSYRRIPRFPALNMHRIRLDCLTHSICDAIQGGVDIDHERLLDSRIIREAYVTKIDQVKNLIEVGCQPESPELTKRIVDNDEQMERILSMASSMLIQNNPSSDSGTNCLLMGDTPAHLSSADIYLAVLIIRMKKLDEIYLDSRGFDKYPEIRI